MKFIAGINGALLVLALGCAETGTAPAEQPVKPVQQLLGYVEEGDQSPPVGVPPEYTLPTRFFVEADAGYQPDGGFAYGSAIVRYLATNALARITLRTALGEETAESQEWHGLPIVNDHMVDVTVPMNPCTGEIRANAVGKIWNEWINPVTLAVSQWGMKSGSDTRDYTCPSVPPGTGGGTSGGGGGGGSCYTIAIDHYWYYPDTGDVEYRYTEYKEVCNAQAEI